MMLIISRAGKRDDQNQKEANKTYVPVALLGEPQKQTRRNMERTKKQNQRINMKTSYIPVSKLNNGELQIRREKERTKKEKQRNCKKVAKATYESSSDDDDDVENAIDTAMEKVFGPNEESCRAIDDDLSAYEILRQKNIEDRNKKLQENGLKNFF